MTPPCSAPLSSIWNVSPADLDAVIYNQTLSDRLLGHRWPGNVRELENAIESLVALSLDGDLDLSLLPGPIVPGAGAAGRRATLKDRMEAYERGLIATALQETRGNRTEAAKNLGVSRATFHEKLRKYRLGED